MPALRIDVGQLYLQRAALGHRVARVDREIENSCLELNGVGMRKPKLRSLAEFQGNRITQRSPQEIGDPADDCVEVDRFRLQHAAARNADEMSWSCPLRDRCRSPAIAPCSLATSSIASANSFFSLRFSSSSAFSLQASKISIPPYFERQV